MGFCLIKSKADEFIKRIKAGEINPDRMMSMTSTERKTFFQKFLSPDEAKNVNLEFEKKLLLKNQEKGMIKWAEDLSGVSTKQRQELIEKIKARKEERLGKIFDPKEEELFLEDLVQKKLGVGVTMEETKTLYELSKRLEKPEILTKNKIYSEIKDITGELSKKEKKIVDDLVDKLEANLRGKESRSEAMRKIKYYLKGEKPSKEISETVDSLVDRIVKAKKSNIEYGAAKETLENYVQEIKLGIKTPMSIGKAVVDTAGFAKSVVASIDNSFIGRQGIKTLFTHPTKWYDAFKESFKLLYKTGIKGEDALRGLRAEIFGRENSINGLYKKMKLDIGTVEEAYPTTLPEKIPLLGRAFKSSNAAFTGSAYKMRADLSDLLIKKMTDNGVDLTVKENAEALGRLINSMTGRGTTGIGKLGTKTNVMFFSPKFLQSNLDTLTAHLFDPKMAKFAKKEAALNLAKIITGIGSILVLADTLQPGSVEWDPRSSDFGKIRIGDARFDVTGGMGSIVTLAARMITGDYKSSTTGIVKKKGEFGSQNLVEMFATFMENKMSPFASSVKNIVKGENFERDPITWKAFKEDPAHVGWVIGKGILIPIPLENAYDAFKKTDTETALVATMLDMLGVSANVYSYSDNWNAKDTKEMREFKEDVGKEKFKEANDMYNSLVNEKLLELRKDKEFMEASNEDKQKEIDDIKRKAKKKVFKKY